jgi:fumarylacetoacetase
MNNWSARDIQAWEYVPLGPFLAKNFCTTISAWVVMPDALAPFTVEGLEPGDRKTLLPYLQEAKTKNVYDITLTVDLTTSAQNTTQIVETNSKYLLYSFPQMLTHHTVGGCPIRVGDLIASGTISGLTVDSRGALIEQTTNGKEPIMLDGGGKRSFLERTST